MAKLFIIGSGGHAKVVIDAARASGVEIGGTLDDNADLHGADVLGVPIVGDTSSASLVRLGVTHAVIAIGSNTVRRDIAARLEGAVTWQTVVHPTAYISPDATVGAGVTVIAGAIIQPGAVVGDHAIINTMTSVDHDVTVGDFCHISRAHMSGGSAAREGAFLGACSTVIPSVTVGAWAMIGAGAVVVKDIPDYATAVGVPARVIRIDDPNAPKPEPETG